MGEPLSGTPPPNGGPPEARLDSWKEIAAYVNRDVTTVQRWEKREGMPVHRHLHEKRGSVYALTEELDGWIQSRRARLDETEEKPDVEPPPTIPQEYGATPARGIRLPITLVAIVCIGLLAAAWLLFRHRPPAAGEAAIRSIADKMPRRLRIAPASSTSCPSC